MVRQWLQLSVYGGRWDDKTVAWLLERSLTERQREEEAEEEEGVKRLEDEVALLEGRLLELLEKDRAEGVRVTRHTWAALSRVEQAAVLWFLARDKVTQRKEKRKKNLLRTSSHSSSGRARRRQRQWHARKRSSSRCGHHGRFVARRTVMQRHYCSGMCKALFAGIFTSR